MDTFLKFVLLTVAIWFWTVIIGKSFRGQSISWSTLAMAAAAVAGFAYMQGWLA